MNKSIVVSFPDEASARRGIEALTELKSEHFLLHGAGIVIKDDSGKLAMQVVSDEGWRLIAAGVLLGGLAGLSVDLLAAAILAAGGAVSGAGAALTHRGAGERLMEKVARRLRAGSAAIVADVETGNVDFIITRMEALGGSVLHQE